MMMLMVIVWTQIMTVEFEGGWSRNSHRFRLNAVAVDRATSTLFSHVDILVTAQQQPLWNFETYIYNNSPPSSFGLSAERPEPTP
jgi:hypothetical protein